MTFSFAPTFIAIIGYYQPASGSSNPARFTLNFSNFTRYGAYMSQVTTSFESRYMMSQYDFSKPYVKKSSDGKTIYWYLSSSDSANYICNASGCVYYFLGAA